MQNFWNFHCWWKQPFYTRDSISRLASFVCSLMLLRFGQLCRWVYRQGKRGGQMTRESSPFLWESARNVPALGACWVKCLGKAVYTRYCWNARCVNVVEWLQCFKVGGALVCLCKAVKEEVVSEVLLLGGAWLAWLAEHVTLDLGGLWVQVPC